MKEFIYLITKNLINILCCPDQLSISVPERLILIEFSGYVLKHQFQKQPKIHEIHG